MRSLLLALASITVSFAAAAWADENAPRSLFVMKSDGSEVRHVIHVAGYFALGSPRWSHDGKRLVFDARNPQPDANRCFVAGADGAGLVEVGPGTLSDWSPDDKQFAFAAGPNKSLKPGIWVQDTNGRGRSWLAVGTAPRWSPDGGQIAFDNGTLKILDLADGTTRIAIDPSQKIWRMQFGFDWSPDGKRLAVVIQHEMGDRPRDVLIVDASGSAEPRTRLTGPVNDVAWSPDGKTLAVSIFDKSRREHRIHLLSADGDDRPVEISGQSGDNREPAWSPDGKLLAFASSRRDIERGPDVSPARQAALELVRAHDKGGTVYSVGLTPDGRTAFVGGDMTNRGVQIWDTTSGDVLRTIDTAGIFVAVSPDGKHGASAPFIGGNIDYFDLTDGTALRQFGHGSQVACLNFSGDGSRLVSSGTDKAACVFDVASGERLARIEHPDDVKKVAFSPDGKLIASTCNDRKLYLWNAATGEKVQEVVHPACPWGVAFSPDGRHVMTGTGGVLVGKRSDLMIQPEPDNTLRIWDVESGVLVREMKGHTHTIAGVAYSPDGRRAVSASFDRSLRLWDVESGQELSSVVGKGWVTQAVFSFDGDLVLASGGAEKNFEQRKWYEFPDERVRLFKIVTQQAAAAGTGQY